MHGMAAGESDSRAFLDKSHELALWMIQLADTKASILTAASAGLAGLLFLQPIPTCNSAARYVLLVAVGFALLSTFACLETIYPRTSPREQGSLLYFRAIRTFVQQGYVTRVGGISAAETVRELARQTWELAGTQERKYLWLRRSVVAFALALVPAAIGLVWAHWPCAV